MQVIYAYPLVPVANFLSCLISLIPVPWLLQHWNTGAWTHGIWSALMCFITGINTILWADNVDIKAIVWCDISTRIFHAAGLAVVTTNFVMARRCCLIMHLQSPLSESQKTRAKLFDLFVSIGIPVISIGLAWFIQGHRFTILEGAGCVFAYFHTPVYLALYEVWFVIFGGACAVYGAFIFRALIRRRNALRDATLVDPDIYLEQFRRVIALGCTECLFTLPCTIYIFIMDVSTGIEPWKGLADAHFKFSAIWQAPASLFGRRDNITIQWNNWVTVFVAITFFIFFGTSKAMWNDYWETIVALAQRLGIELPSSRTRPIKKQEDVPPIVFKVSTTPQTSMYPSRGTVTRQDGGPETRHQSDIKQDLDLEKGVSISSAANTKDEASSSFKDITRTTLDLGRGNNSGDSVSSVRYEAAQGSDGEAIAMMQNNTSTN